MNIKGIIIILAAICVGLGIALFMTRKQAADQHAADVNSLTEYSNQVVDAHERLTEAGQVNLTLSNELAASQQQLTLGAEQAAQLSNRLAAADTALTDTQAALDDARTALAGARGQVTNLTTHVSELEARNTFLSQQAEALRGSLAQLTRDIENTRNQLAVTKTNAAFLQGELQKQLAQKAELEHKFNDLDELRGQVKKIKDENFVARRREWMKSDNSLKKGGELLMMHNAPTAGAASRAKPDSAYDLNVEIGSDGSVKVIPPPGHTNAPAH